MAIVGRWGVVRLAASSPIKSSSCFTLRKLRALNSAPTHTNIHTTRPTCNMSFQGSDSTKIESILFINSPVYIYGIPPLKSISRGYRANEWDVSKPLWEGRLKVVEISDPTNEESEITCELRLEDETTGELFASAPYSSEGKGVDSVCWSNGLGWKQERRVKPRSSLVPFFLPSYVNLKTKHCVCEAN